MQKTTIALGAVLGIAVIASGCAKASLNATQQQQNAASMMAQAMQLPSPDNSYTVMQASQATGSGFNVGSVLIPQIFDKLAIAMRETNMHLWQTVSQGATSNGSLSISLQSLGTSLTGTVNSAQGSIAYNYTVNGSSYAGSGSTYFTASIASSGVSGNMNFPGNSNADALTVNFNIQSTGGKLVKNVTVANARWGNLNFVENFSTSTTVPDSVTMSYSISGATGTGSWSAVSGGSFTDVGGTKRCFSANLQDVNPCN